MKKNYDVYVFTASKKEYADCVLDYIDPQHIIKKCFYREDCIGIKDKVFIKDLRILENKKLQDIVILDNALYAFVNQLTNGVLINSFYGCGEDTELFNVMEYLVKYLAEAEDIRSVNERVFGFDGILNDIKSEAKVYHMAK